jgi:hypothetical protein
MTEFIWTDELVKRYAEIYRFSSSRISIEQFKLDPLWGGESVLKGYGNSLLNSEQGAKECDTSKAK